MIPTPSFQACEHHGVWYQLQLYLQPLRCLIPHLLWGCSPEASDRPHVPLTAQTAKGRADADLWAPNILQTPQLTIQLWLDGIQQIPLWGLSLSLHLCLLPSNSEPYCPSESAWGGPLSSAPLTPQYLISSESILLVPHCCLVFCFLSLFPPLQTPSPQSTVPGGSGLCTIEASAATSQFWGPGSAGGRRHQAQSVSTQSEQPARQTSTPEIRDLRCSPQSDTPTTQHPLQPTPVLLRSPPAPDSFAREEEELPWAQGWEGSVCASPARGWGCAGLQGQWRGRPGCAGSEWPRCVLCR